MEKEVQKGAIVKFLMGFMARQCVCSILQVARDYREWISIFSVNDRLLVLLVERLQLLCEILLLGFQRFLHL